jgi:hypothetical protein
MVMEYMDNGDLATWLRNKAFASPTLMTAADPFAEGLGFDIVSSTHFCYYIQVHAVALRKFLEILLPSYLIRYFFSQDAVSNRETPVVQSFVTIYGSIL